MNSAVKDLIFCPVIAVRRKTGKFLGFSKNAKMSRKYFSTKANVSSMLIDLRYYI